MEWLANLFGLVSFSVEGAVEGTRKYSNFICTVLCTMMTAFGGGFVFRDTLLLKTTPIAFSCGTDVLISLCVALLTYVISVIYRSWYIRITRSRAFGTVIMFMDACGSGMYIAAGIRRAVDHGFFGWRCILSGIVSTIGGGFLSGLLCEPTPEKAIKKSISYRLIVVHCAIQHYMLIKANVSFAEAQRQTVLQVILLCELKQVFFDVLSFFGSGSQCKKIIIINKTAYLAYLEFLLSGYRNTYPHWLTQRHEKLRLQMVIKTQGLRTMSNRAAILVIRHRNLEYHILTKFQ